MYALLSLAPVSLGQDSEIKQFELFANCQPLAVLHQGYVEEGVLTDHAKSLGLTAEGIQATLESRLRAARLFNHNQLSPTLLINITVIDNAYYMSLQLRKLVYDEASGIRNLVTTWDRSLVGVHVSDSGPILSKLSELTDQFLTEYLRVNESACE